MLSRRKRVCHKNLRYCGGTSSVKEGSLEFSRDFETTLILNETVSSFGFYHVHVNSVYEVL